jgi:hypothetical protein
MLLRAVPRPSSDIVTATARPPTVGGRPLNEVLGPKCEHLGIPALIAAPSFSLEFSTARLGWAVRGLAARLAPAPLQSDITGVRCRP